jgi:hypothetical protein
MDLMPALPDSSSLLAAVSAARMGELELDVEPGAREAVRASLTAGFVLLGEIHGVRENAAIMAVLIREFGIGGLALEWSTSVGEPIAAWRQGGPLPEDSRLWLGDGRVTAGHYALLQELSAMPVALFDVDLIWTPTSWSDRDAAMAKTVLELPPVAGGWLVVAGNLHTATTETDFGIPMGLHLVQARPEVRSITIRYESGSFYNGGRGRFRDLTAGRPPRPAGAPATLELAGGELVLNLARAGEADVPHRARTLP